MFKDKKIEKLEEMIKSLSRSVEALTAEVAILRNEIRQKKLKE